MSDLKVWTCKIIVAGDAELPPGFDYPPRMAACAAVEAHGVEVLGCSSGWGGFLTPGERAAFDDTANIVGAWRDQVYIAGLMDAPEDVEH